jgi:hypothetical protein
MSIKRKLKTVRRRLTFGEAWVTSVRVADLIEKDGRSFDYISIEDGRVVVTDLARRGLQGE